jgi:precorrin-6A synthase
VGSGASDELAYDGDCAFLDCPPATEIWWGAYLGTPDELLLAGTVADVGERIAAVRAEARNRHGWIMDIYLLRS